VPFDLKGTMAERQQLVDGYLRDLLAKETGAPPALVDSDIIISLLDPAQC